MALFYDKQNNNLYVNNFSDDAVQLLNPQDGSVVETYLFGDGVQHITILEATSSTDPWADVVVDYIPGNNAGFGQNYYSKNVLGPPDPDPLLSEFNPSNKPQEILSLGDAGEIILEFTDNFIFDGNGPDFTVFENVFYFFGTTDPFIEAAFVAASMDGEIWYEFPWDTTTWEGFAGVTPMFDNQNPTDPSVSGGDQFDLEDIGLPYAKYIKLTDLGAMKQEGLFNGDFDLDAVVAINSQEGQPTAITLEQTILPANYSLEQNYPNPFNPSTTINYKLPVTSYIDLSIFNLQGQKVATLVSGTKHAGNHQIQWDATGFASGVYLYHLSTDNGFVATKRMILLR
jgi:hypothetical protein